MHNNHTQRIFHIVRSIPRGKVATYTYVARKAGVPKAARYVGNVLGNNRSSRVPCHRVVRKDGHVGGFRDGTREKVRRLRREGVVIRGNCVGAEHILQ